MKDMLLRFNVAKILTLMDMRQKKTSQMASQIFWRELEEIFLIHSHKRFKCEHVQWFCCMTLCRAAASLDESSPYFFERKNKNALNAQLSNCFTDLYNIPCELWNIIVDVFRAGWPILMPPLIFIFIFIIVF